MKKHDPIEKLLHGLKDQSVFLLDLDDTVWDDILILLNEQFGSEENGAKVWRSFDRAFKIDGTMTNVEHLKAEYDDLMTRHCLSELTNWLHEGNHDLLPGFYAFMRALAERNIKPVAISSGVSDFILPMFRKHDLAFPVIANSFIYDDDGAYAGVNFLCRDDNWKGHVAQRIIEAGGSIVGCAGDSKADRSMAKTTIENLGFVVSFGDGLSDFLEQEASSETWLRAKDWTAIDTISALLDRHCALALSNSPNRSS